VSAEKIDKQWKLKLRLFRVAHLLVSLALLTPWMASTQELWVRLPGDNLFFVGEYVLLFPNDSKSMMEELGELGELAPPAKLKFQWYSVSLLKNGSLEIGSVTQTRSPDWIVTVEPSEDEPVAPVSHAHTLALPDSALLGFRFLGEDDAGKNQEEPATHPQRVRLGTYPSAAQPFVLTTGTRIPITIGKESWILFTEYERRNDGRLLDGSVALVATDPSGERMVLVPPAVGMAFTRQEVLWIGRIATRIREPKENVPPSFILRRTWITGEVDYIVVIEGETGYAYFDPDRAIQSVSYCQERGAARHVVQHRQPPTGEFGSAAFKVPLDVWTNLEKQISATGLPGTLFDRQLVVNGETIRFTFEYLPSFEIAEDASIQDTSRSPYYPWGKVLVKVHFRGKSQVLTGSSADGSDGDFPFRVQVGQLNGELAIRAEAYPTYCTHLLYYWVWSEADGRFLRLLKSDSQCC
jgi:hypothetical protein